MNPLVFYLIVGLIVSSVLSLNTWIIKRDAVKKSYVMFFLSWILGIVLWPIELFD